MGIEDWSESRRGLSVDLSRVLADLRIGAGWTQVELALRMGVNDATVGSWEHGVAGVPAARLPQMAQVLRLSLHDLTYGAPWRRIGVVGVMGRCWWRRRDQNKEGVLPAWRKLIKIAARVVRIATATFGPRSKKFPRHFARIAAAAWSCAGSTLRLLGRLRPDGLART
jgi:transcriptional regulator with XRE-family HTH domain